MGRSGSHAFRRTVVMAALIASSAVVVPEARAEAPSPSLEEMPDDVGLLGHPMWDPWFDLEAFGYEAHEFFVSGTAAATGGGGTADYTTRMIVVHPSNSADFSGTVLLDWVNVTAQFENAVHSLTSVQFMLREGWAWVHVSAQSAGLCCTPLTPKVADPVRYAAIDHPGDEYANDMFSQIAQAFRTPGDVHPLQGMDAEVILAGGQSQSANRLTDYVTTTQDDARVIDGFLIQAEGSKAYTANPGAPVFHVLGEREATPQEPTSWPNYHLWEVAGAAHADSWIGRQQTEGSSLRLAGLGRQSRAYAESLWASAGNLGESVDPRQLVCVVNGALFPTRFTTNAAFAHLDRWVRDGVAPPAAPRYEFDGDALARDGDRNAIGGLRLPTIEVPLASYDSAMCNLGGITVPFTPADLIQRYGNHQTYYDLVAAATTTSLAAGHLLPDDADELLQRSCAARAQFGELSTEPCVASAPPASDDDAPDPAPDDESTPAGPRDGDPDPEDGTNLPATGGGAVVAAGVMLVLATTGRRRP